MPFQDRWLPIFLNAQLPSLHNLDMCPNIEHQQFLKQMGPEKLLAQSHPFFHAVD